MKKSYYNIFINILGYEMKMKYHKLGIIDRNTRKNERSNELREGINIRVTSECRYKECIDPSLVTFSIIWLNGIFRRKI